MESAYFFDDHCDSALEAFPNLARGTFLEYEASAEEMVPSFNFADRCAEYDAECAARETRLQKKGDARSCISVGQ